MSDTMSIDAAAAQITALLAQIETSNARVVEAQDVGTADAYVFAPTPAVASYGPDLFMLVDIANPNQTQTPKLNVSGVGWVNLTASDGSPVAIGAVAGKCLLGFSTASGGGYVARHMFALSAALLATLLTGLAQGIYLGSPTGGTSTALTTVLSPVPPKASNGLRMQVPITTTNGNDPTLAFNTAAGEVTAELVVNATGFEPTGGEMPGGVGYVAEVEYDGTYARLLNPAKVVSLCSATASGGVTLQNSVLTPIPFTATTCPFGAWSGSTFTFSRTVQAIISATGQVAVNTVGSANVNSELQLVKNSGTNEGYTIDGDYDATGVIAPSLNVSGTDYFNAGDTLQVEAAGYASQSFQSSVVYSGAFVKITATY